MNVISEKKKENNKQKTCAIEREESCWETVEKAHTTH